MRRHALAVDSLRLEGETEPWAGYWVGKCRCGEAWIGNECVTCCASCHKPQHQGQGTVCGECYHVWRWRWQLSLHDARVTWRLGGWQWHGDLVADPWWRRIRLRRPSKVWVCPCCSHDL